MKIEVSLQTKQILSQAQVQSLNILAMSMMELQEFLQNEEIENPLIEHSLGNQQPELPVSYQEYTGVFARTPDKDSDPREVYAGEVHGQSVEDMIFAQLPWNCLGDTERKIVEFCVHSLDQSGYLPISIHEVADALQVDEDIVSLMVSVLKKLEPRGIFSADLKECLLIQVQGMDQEELLQQVISHYLAEVAEGKISTISRALKISSADVRKLVHVLKKLNPRPLNGYGEERTQYVLPDVLLEFQEGQWIIRLNDKWTGSFGISDFYVRMMESVQDEVLRMYFEEKLQRARFVMHAVEQRRKTLIAISEHILKHQEAYLRGHGPLKPMTLEQIAAECEIHKSTVSRAIREKYLLAPRGCVPMRALFTTGVSGGSDGDETVSRNAVKERIRELVAAEDKSRPYSDEQIVQLLKQNKIEISRRTAAKYRAELGIGGVFQRRDG